MFHLVITTRNSLLKVWYELVDVFGNFESLITFLSLSAPVSKRLRNSRLVKSANGKVSIVVITI